MNKLFYCILFTMLSVFGFASCGYDNLEEPESIPFMLSRKDVLVHACLTAITKL